MNLSCEIVQDLLLLYTDGACSPESRRAVEEHLARCPACRRHMEALKLPDTMAETPPEPVVQERVMKNSFRKLRRRWLLSVLSVLLLFPLLLLGIMGVHEYRGEGLAFTNLDEMFLARRLMGLIEKRRFEEAAGLIDFESKYQDIREILAWTPEDYMPSFAFCTVDGERWAATPNLAEQYRLQELCEDGGQLWAYLVFNRVQGILIPEAAWEQFISGLPAEELEYNEVYDTYFLIETPWGRFYTGSDELRDSTELTAVRLIQYLEFVPDVIYQEAQEGLSCEAQQTYQWNQEYYSFAADMTQEEYVQAMEDKFVQIMESCYADGAILQHPHFASAYRMGRQWEVEISATQQNADGQSYWVRYAFFIQNGKLLLVGSSHPDELHNDPIAAALRLSCP